jgi:ribosomal protein S20
MNQFESPKNSAEEPREIKKLNFYKNTARKTLCGELTYGDTVYEDLKKSLEEAEEAGVDVSALKVETEEIIDQIPRAEINNVLKKTEEFIEGGDIASAKSWHADLEKRIGYWESKGIFENEEMLAFQKRCNEIGSKLYS